MDTTPRPTDSTLAARPETQAEMQRRLAREAEMIAEARAELDAGLFVDAAEIDAWIDSIGTERELPPPPSRQR
jgi:predicted transcriptional regulator